MCGYCNGQIAKEVNEGAKRFEKLLDIEDYKLWQKQAISKMCRQMAFNNVNRSVTEYCSLRYYIDPEIKVLIFHDGDTFVPVNYCPNCGRKLYSGES